MMEDKLESQERSILLNLARQAIESAVQGRALPALDLESLPPRLCEPGASFVTLTRKGQLRGCIGALEPRDPLALDVREHAIAAALNDFRFTPVQPEELPEIRIEISRLTIPRDLEYRTPEELPKKIKPGVDGVILRDGMQRATFLPQVWEKLPEPWEFLDHLCMKMGTLPDLWRHKKLHVQVYQVDEFHE